MSDQEKQGPQLDNRLSQHDMTGFGITTKQLWLIIGLNSLISTVISLLVVLVVGPWASTGAVSGLFTGTPGLTSQLPVVEGTPLDAVTATPETPASTATPTPHPEPILYEVLPGDTLSQIAEVHNVPLSDLMEANGLNDPDELQAGQTLLIPVGGPLNTTPTFTPEALPTETPLPIDPPTPDGKPRDDVSIAPTETPTPVPTATAPPIGEVRVTISTVLGYGEVEEEVVTILNEGPGVNLSGWKLSGSTVDDYNFPNLFLWNGGSVRIHTKTGTNTPSDLYWGQSEPRWFSGDTVSLIDAAGETISSYIIP